jgi:allantoinase
MCSGPAELVRLERKATIARGFDADLAIWDPDARFQVDGAALQHRSPLTPYHGETLYGVVDTTIVGGEIVYQNGRHAERASGRFLLRG